ncbi:hypothetical protein PG994_015019 [Apiospora phragmitis]|uniref:Uncharacterized protein n=1 Tax=Apiospora phragmitis TaxID=2905665 RepID=A0ABR1SVA1_9PEZI
MVAKWSAEDIQRLLFSLNISVDIIRQGWPYEDNSCEKSSREDRKVGIAHACRHLATIFPDYSTAQLQKKMMWLWTNFGPDDGDREPDALFLEGAWVKTLPHLESEYPDIWDRVDQDVRNDRDHVLGDTILCTNPACSFWQHVRCYYGADDSTVAPEDHLCDQCHSLQNLEEGHEMMQSSEETLAPNPHGDEPSNLDPNIDGPFTFETHTEQRSNANPDSGDSSTSNNLHTEEPFKESLAPFERQYAAANIQWAPDSDEIQSHLKRMSLQWVNISKSLTRDGFLLAEVPMMERLRKQMHISSFFAYPHEKTSDPPSKRVTERWLRAMLVACAVDWVFYPVQTMTDQITGDETSSVSRLNAELNPVLAHSINTELTTRCKLVPFLTVGESRSALRFAPPNISTMVEGESPWRISELTAVFSQLLRLKLQLSLSHSNYELWFPEKSSPEDLYYSKGLVVPPTTMVPQGR